MMRTLRFTLVLFIGFVVGLLHSPSAVPAADPDWKPVEQALGKSGWPPWWAASPWSG